MMQLHEAHMGWDPQRWCAWTSPCTLVQCCDVEGTGTWSLQQRGREIDDEHHINLHQMFDLLAPPEMFRTVEWWGMGEEENAPRLASCRWHPCVGVRIFLTHDTFTEKSLKPIFTNQTNSMVRPSDWGVAWLFLRHLTTGGQQIYFDYLIISWFSCFFQKKTYILGIESVQESVAKFGRWKGMLVWGCYFLVNWWRWWFLPNLSSEADGESSGDIAIYLWVGASIWQKIWVVVNGRPAAFSYVFMFLLVIVISMKLHVGLW